MSNNELNAKIEELQSWKQLLAEAKAEVEAREAEFKTILTQANLEELDTGLHVIRFTTYTRRSFDNDTFKKLNPEIFNAFLKLSTYKRFSIT